MPPGLPVLLQTISSPVPPSVPGQFQATIPLVPAPEAISTNPPSNYTLGRVTKKKKKYTFGVSHVHDSTYITHSPPKQHHPLASTPLTAPLLPPPRTSPRNLQRRMRILDKVNSILIEPFTRLWPRREGATASAIRRKVRRVRVARAVRFSAGLYPDDGVDQAVSGFRRWAGAETILYISHWRKSKVILYFLRGGRGEGEKVVHTLRP